MKTNLKDNIWIEGFDEFTFAYEKFNDLVRLPNGTIYGGKTKNIPYSVAENCVDKYTINQGSDSERTLGYFDYKRNEKSKWIVNYDSSIDSIKSACDYEYCLIYKISKQDNNISSTPIVSPTNTIEDNFNNNYILKSLLDLANKHSLELNEQEINYFYNMVDCDGSLMAIDSDLFLIDKILRKWSYVKDDVVIIDKRLYGDIYKFIDLISHKTGEVINEYYWRESCGLMREMDNIRIKTM